MTRFRESEHSFFRVNSKSPAILGEAFVCSRGSSLSLAVFCGVLLGAKDNRFRAVFTVDLVECLVDAFQLLVPFGIIINEIGLYAVVGTNAHDDDTGTFIMEPLAVNPLQAFVGCLVNLLGALAAYCFFPKKPCIACDRAVDNQLTLF